MKKVGFKYAQEKRNLPISLLVYHCYAVPTKKMLKIFTQTGTSVHYLIQRNGRILSLVDEKNVAYHAGRSSWREFDQNINQRSIGIEIQNSKMGEVRYTQAQIKSLIRLSKRLIKKYQIQPENIVGHCDIAPLRKPDPGCFFPWRELARHGIGKFPKKTRGAVLDENVLPLLENIGYDITDVCASLYAFTKRFAPHRAPVFLEVVQQESKVFDYWGKIKRQEFALHFLDAPCIYPKNAIELKNDVEVIEALNLVASLYQKDKK